MKIALFTITQNDPWLNHWVDHHISQGFNREDIYVLNHESTGDFATLMDADISRTVSVVQVRHPQSYDYLWLTETVSKFQRFLIGNYDVVVFAAADELLYPVEKRTVMDALQVNSQEPWEYVDAWEVIQNLAEGRLVDTFEMSSIVLPEPWTARRRQGCLSKRGRRIRITRSVTVWMPPVVGSAGPFTEGFNVPPGIPVSSQIVVAHMHRADLWLAATRHREISKRTLFPYRDDQYNPYKHNLILGTDALTNWLITDPDNPKQPAAWTRLPMASKEVADGGPDVSSGEAPREQSAAAAELSGGS